MPRFFLSLAAIATGLPQVAACQTSVCDAYEVDPQRCAAYQRASDPDGAEVCACPVQVASAGQPFCLKPDLNAALAITFEPKSDDTHYHFGSYPSMAGLDTCSADTLLERMTDGAATELGCLPRDVPDNIKNRTWVEPYFSPDGAYLGVFSRLGPTVGGEPVATVMKCQDGDDPGWIAERVFQHVTTPFLRWGARTEQPREVYFAQGGLNRYRLRTDQRVLVDGDPRPAMIIEGRELIARDNDGDNGPLANADHDVSFERAADGSYSDRYLVFISSYVRNVIDIGADLIVSDLHDCRLDACAADPDMQFCCRSALLATGYWNDLQIPTNPAFSHDGSLIAFNRFTSKPEDCGGSKLCAQVHLLKNPLAHGALLDRCASDGTLDGFGEAIDCRALTTSQDVWDDSRCPDHHCCSDAQIDCSTCVTIGPRSDGTPACSFASEGFRERNYLAFFDLGDQRFVAWRSYDFVGAEHLSELQVYKVGLDGDEIALAGEAEGFPKRVVLADLNDSDPAVAWSNFGPAPLRRLGPPPCSGGAPDGGSGPEDGGTAPAVDSGARTSCPDPARGDGGVGSSCGCASGVAADSAGQLPALLVPLALWRRLRPRRRGPRRDSGSSEGLVSR